MAVLRLGTLSTSVQAGLSLIITGFPGSTVLVFAASAGRGLYPRRGCSLIRRENTVKPVCLPDGENALARKAVSPLCPFFLSLQKWLPSQTPRWLLKSALFFCFLESNQLVSENHLPLSGQQWPRQAPLCLQVEWKRHWSLPILKGQRAAKALLLQSLS